MKELIEITVDPEIGNDPARIGRLIHELASDIDSCRGDLSVIQNRSWFKRMFANNSRDLAEAMIKQNDMIFLFLNVVQALIMLNMYNLVFLAGVQEELVSQEKGRGDFDNKYVQMAKEFLKKSLDNARAVSEKLGAHSEGIERLTNQMEEKRRLDDEQSRLLEELNRKYSDKEEIDREQTRQIEALVRELTKKTAEDGKQTRAIERLRACLADKEHLDLSQSERLVALERKCDTLENELAALNGEHLEIKKSPRTRAALVFGVMGMVIGLIALLVGLSF